MSTVNYRPAIRGLQSQSDKQAFHLIHDQHGAVLQLGHVLHGQIQDAPRSCNHDMHDVMQAHDIVAQAGPTSSDHDLNAQMLAQFFADLAGLQGELAGGHKDHACRVRAFS